MARLGLLAIVFTTLLLTSSGCGNDDLTFPGAEHTATPNPQATSTATPEATVTPTQTPGP